MYLSGSLDMEEERLPIDRSVYRVHAAIQSTSCSSPAPSRSSSLTYLHDRPNLISSSVHRILRRVSTLRSLEAFVQSCKQLLRPHPEKAYNCGVVFQPSAAPHRTANGPDIRLEHGITLGAHITPPCLTPLSIDAYLSNYCSSPCLGTSLSPRLALPLCRHIYATRVA
jgi:hypothetical protein